MGGFREWWDKMMGKGSTDLEKQQAKEDGDNYAEMKADSYVEQRDPGLMHMTDDER